MPAWVYPQSLNQLFGSAFFSLPQQGDIFAGINDGILSRAEALAAVDIQKHQAQHVHSQMPSQIKHDVMYHHHTMSGPPQRPLQVSAKIMIDQFP